MSLPALEPGKAFSLSRPRLLRQLQSVLRRGHVAVLAPAGYGKTVLLQTLAANRPDTHYFALTPADADLGCCVGLLKSGA